MIPIIKRMTIQRGKHGLGFILSSQGPCVVSSVNQNGPADKAGLKPGDEIIKVNDEDVAELKHDDVVKQILLYDSQSIHVTVRTFSNTQFPGETVNRRNSLFDSINRVVKGARRTSLIFGSPATPHKCEMNGSNNCLADTCSTNHKKLCLRTETEKGRYDITSLSKRRVIKEIDSSPPNSSKTLIDNQLQNGHALNLSNLFGIEKNTDVESLAQIGINSKLTPIKSECHIRTHPYNVVVYYQCTVEIPNAQNLHSASLNTLNSCVYKIQRSSKSSRSLVLLTLSSQGVKLSNPLGKEIVTYPLRTLVFSGICPDDQRFFALVTRKVLSDQSPAMSSNHSNSPVISKGRNVVLCSCHVFMIDLNLVSHDAHIGSAALFDLSCKPATKFQGCSAFPTSSSYILHELNNFYEERKSLFHNSSASPAKSLSYSSSPERTIITNTLERIRGNSFNGSSPIDTKKLMVNPPSSLTGLNEEEKREILKEIEAQKDAESDSNEDSDYYHSHPRDGARRRKSAPDTEACTNVAKHYNSLQKGYSLTNSLRLESRKPPVPIRNFKNNTVEQSESKNQHVNFFSGLKRTFRRKSEGAALSPSPGLRDFLKGSLSKRQETPQSVARYEPRKDTNENLKRLSLSSASSELSLNDATSRVEEWAKSFERLLTDAVGLKCFQEFLKKEFSEENVLFWIACERFKLSTDLDKMKICANEIFRNYLSHQAPYLVNVNQTAVKKAEENLNTPNINMFTIPQEQVYQLMKFDSYNRFLKSDLYNECLLAENEDRLFPFEDEIDEELRKKPAWAKKSKPSALDHERKRNLLNFLTKGRSPKPHEPDKLRKDRSSSLGAVDEMNRRNGVLADASNHMEKDSQLWDGLNSQSKSSFIRVILPDGASTMVVAISGQTIRQCLHDTCERKKISLATYDVTAGFDKQVACLDNDISTVTDNVIFLERRVLFRFDLPNGRSVGIKANPSKTLRDVLQPVLKKNGFDIDNFTVHVVNCKVGICLDTSISSVENKRIVTKLAHKKLEKQNSDSLVGKPSQDFRSSFRRFRTNSFKDEKHRTDRRGSLDRLEKERLAHKKSDDFKNDEKFGRKLGNEVKHLILGRTKSADDDGANALMTVLQKSQSGRLDDQRGMLTRDLELPDFLKVTFGTPSPIRSKPIQTFAQTTNSTQSSPAHSSTYPATPIIIDRLPEFKRSEESLDRADLSLSLNSSMNSARPSLCSVRSWKELPSPDRELIDSSFTSREGINLTPTTDCSLKDRKTLLEISRSDPALIKHSMKPTVTKGNSVPLKTNLFPVQTAVITDPQSNIDRNRSRSFETIDIEKDATSNVRYNTLPNNRPQPINTFNQNDILRGLEVAGYDVIQSERERSPETPSGSIEHHYSSNTNGFVNSAFSSLPSQPCTANTLTNSVSLNGGCHVQKKTLDSAHSAPPLKVDIRRNINNERIGSVDLLEYDLSPRSYEASRIQLAIEQKRFPIKEESVFESNAIPTPEKSKLLQGETIRGRQNEKITFV